MDISSQKINTRLFLIFNAIVADDMASQGISSHEIDVVILDYFGFDATKVKKAEKH